MYSLNVSVYTVIFYKEAFQKNILLLYNITEPEDISKGILEFYLCTANYFGCI